MDEAAYKIWGAVNLVLGLLLLAVGALLYLGGLNSFTELIGIVCVAGGVSSIDGRHYEPRGLSKRRNEHSGGR